MNGAALVLDQVAAVCREHGYDPTRAQSIDRWLSVQLGDLRYLRAARRQVLAGIEGEFAHGRDAQLRVSLGELAAQRARATKSGG